MNQSCKTGKSRWFWRGPVQRPEPRWNRRSSFFLSLRGSRVVIREGVPRKSPSMWPVLQRLHAEQCGIIRCFLCPPCLRGAERQRWRDREKERGEGFISPIAQTSGCFGACRFTPAAVSSLHTQINAGKQISDWSLWFCTSSLSSVSFSHKCFAPALCISSVRWVHSAVATLLLLLLLHEELLQRRRAWLHHRAWPDRLRTYRGSNFMLHSTQLPVLT